MMGKLTVFLTVLALAWGISISVLAEADDIVVEGAWSRASIGTSRPGAAYLTIRNTGPEYVTLTGIQTDIATRSEIHRSSTNDQGVTSMAPAGEIKIAPTDTVSFEPGGLHVMLMGLQHPMIEGEAFWLTLVFSDGSEVSVEVSILGFAARGPDI